MPEDVLDILKAQAVALGIIERLRLEAHTDCNHAGWDFLFRVGSRLKEQQVSVFRSYFGDPNKEAA